MEKQDKKKPFFVRYLEGQERQAGRADATLKYPSDKDEENTTHKYPSDGDEG
ncbi:microviridin/marinostatin family tricyclic proteinase inhibitor [Nannocystis pusilla]|nr:microviridin/marinostatin family tricyclic proteinase inhibitor [Nannocystis pusilla]